MGWQRSKAAQPQASHLPCRSHKAAVSVQALHRPPGKSQQAPTARHIQQILSKTPNAKEARISQNLLAPLELREPSYPAGTRKVCAARSTSASRIPASTRTYDANSRRHAPSLPPGLRAASHPPLLSALSACLRHIAHKAARARIHPLEARVHPALFNCFSFSSAGLLCHTAPSSRQLSAA